MSVVFVPPKVVHLRNEYREGAPPACGARMHPRIPDYSRTSDPAKVTCKHCRRYL